MSNKELELNKHVQSTRSSKTDKRDVELTVLQKLNEEYPLRASLGVNEQGEKRNRTESGDDHDLNIYGSGTPKRTRSNQRKSRTITNSSLIATATYNYNHHRLNNRNNHSNTNQLIDNVDTGNNKFKITNDAVNYAVKQTLPNIRFICEPKIVDQKDASCLVKELLKLIEPNYKQFNRKINDAFGFETWFIDKNGDLICITRNIELLVYLCNVESVPNKILNTNVTVILPKHLPPQRSIIIKSVPNSIDTDDVKNELLQKYKTIYAIEDILGTNNGIVCIEGHCLHLVEYLAVPRVLFCHQSNEPGHSKRQYQFNYERCKRYGGDRKNGDHKECTIKCHNCNGGHLSTDFKCPDILNYRRDLIKYLQHHPETLPDDIKLFIPSQYRQQGVKTINNQRLSTYKPYFTTHQDDKISNGEWPLLPLPTRSSIPCSKYSYSSSFSSNILDNMVIQMKQIENDCTIAKEEYDRKNMEIKTQVKTSIIQIQSLISCFSTIIQKQNEAISILKNSINECLEYNRITNQAVSFMMSRSNDQQLVEMSKQLTSFPITARQESLDKIFSSYALGTDDLLKKIIDVTMHLHDNYNYNYG
ncbi:unnamed protein product [Rotaria sp. Silwood2]|nr:unnamed protein product [Rotaria sp. Silwood2]CAF4360285.1 unnamed protein product [Rotaria sp. Silwood2]CAF4369017.1 unnamed protein product [Rotaria sp. Silwood2]